MEAGKRNLNFRWEVSGKPGAFLFFLPKGALTHHRVGTNSISFAPPQAAGLIHSVVPPFPTKSTTLWEPFCGGGMPYGIVRSARRMRLLRQPPDNATAPVGAAVIVCAIGQIAPLQLPLFSNRLRKPATGSFAAEMDGPPARPFSLLRKRNRKKESR